MPKALVLIAVLAAAVAAGWYWQHRGALSAPAGNMLAQSPDPSPPLPLDSPATAAPAPTGSDAANQAEAAAEAAIAAAEAAIAAADRAAAGIAGATDSAAQGTAAADPAEAAPAFVDVEKMRDIVETSQSMPAEVKAEILQLLDAAAIDPSQLDAALVKYRAALQ